VELHRHADDELRLVGLRHLRPHGHRRQVGDAQDRRGGLVGVEGLALDRRDRHHGAVDRRDDPRIGEVDLVGGDDRGLADDLGLRLGQLRVEHAHVGERDVEGIAARRVGREHDVLASRLRLRQPPLRLLLRQHAVQPRELGAIGLGARLVDARVDLGEQRSGMDLVADLHEQPLQLARNLRADIDIAERLQRPERADDVVDVPARHFHGGHSALGRFATAEQPPPARSRHGERQHAGDGQPRPARSTRASGAWLGRRAPRRRKRAAGRLGNRRQGEHVRGIAHRAPPAASAGFGGILIGRRSRRCSKVDTGACAICRDRQRLSCSEVGGTVQLRTAAAPPTGDWRGRGGQMIKDLYRHVWRTSGRHQVLLSVLSVTLFLLELAPLELQRRIVNGAVGGEAFTAIASLCLLYVVMALVQGGLKMLLNIYGDP
jgi:hypothetical protein